MTKIYFRFTNKCNLQCRHCCYSCGPKGETMSTENIEKVIEHFPADNKIVMVSGGEAFTEEEKLFHILNILQKRQFPKIRIETNGFWMRNEEQAYANLSRLYGLVSGISVPSNDKFHREQGVYSGGVLHDGPLFKAIDRLATERGLHAKRQWNDTISLFQGMFSPKVIEIWLSGTARTHPFGRGAGVEKENLRDYSSCDMREYKSNEKSWDITISPDGKAYPCCWCVMPSIGSAIESPLEELVEKMKKNELFAAMIEENSPRGAAKVLGVYREADEEIYMRNPCVKCEEIFRGMR